MIIKYPILLLILSLIANGLGAERWYSPDGFLSLEVPSTHTITTVPPPNKSFIGHWQSKDEAYKLAVLRIEVPPGFTPIQSSIEEGMANEMSGTIERLQTETISGYKVWKMKCHNKYGTVIQSVVPTDGYVYKLMVASMGGRAVPESLQKFLTSLQLSEETSSPIPPSTDRQQSHELSKELGGTGLLILIAIMIYIMRKKQ